MHLAMSEHLTLALPADDMWIHFSAGRTCRGATLYIDDVWRRLQAIPFYRTRVAQGGTGPSRQVAVVVKDIIEKFTASADEQIQEQHMPGNPLPLLR